MPTCCPVTSRAQQRADHRQRQRQHDQHRLGERLELRRQHDVDEGDREQHRQAHRRGGLLHQLDVAGEAPLEVRRHRDRRHHLLRRPRSRRRAARPSSSMPTFTCRRRCSRSMLLGPTPGSMRTMSARADDRAVGRVERRAADRREVVAELRREPHADVVFPVAVAQLRRHDAFDHAAELHRRCCRRRSPMSAAISRLMRATISGCPDTSVLSTSTAPGICLIFVVTSSLMPLQLLPCRRRARRRSSGACVRRALHELRLGDRDLQQRHARSAARARPALISAMPRVALVLLRQRAPGCSAERTRPARRRC